MGPQHRRADPQRARLAGHAHGQDRRRAVGRRRPGPLPGEGRPAAGDLLLGAEGPLDPRQRRWRARSGRGGRPGLRQHGHLAHLEPHRWHRRWAAHHRRDERQPHDAHGPQDPLVGRGDRRHHRRADLDAPRDPRLERGLRRGQDRRLHGHPDCRRPGRPAGGHVRPGLPVAGRGQEHLRHRQLPPAQHGHGGGAVQERHAHDRGLQDRRQRRHLLPRGRDRDHRRARAVAARQPQDDQGGARGRGARPDGRGQRRPVHRAGVLGPVRAVLEVERPRRLRGPDALRQRRPHRPRDPGGHGLPEPRDRRGDEPGLRASSSSR